MSASYLDIHLEFDSKGSEEYEVLKFLDAYRRSILSPAISYYMSDMPEIAESDDKYRYPSHEPR